MSKAKKIIIIILVSLLTFGGTIGGAICCNNVSSMSNYYGCPNSKRICKLKLKKRLKKLYNM